MNEAEGSEEVMIDPVCIADRRITACSRLRAYGPTRTPPGGDVANRYNVMRSVCEATKEGGGLSSVSRI